MECLIPNQKSYKLYSPTSSPALVYCDLSTGDRQMLQVNVRSPPQPTSRMTSPHTQHVTYVDLDRYAGQVNSGNFAVDFSRCLSSSHSDGGSICSSGTASDYDTIGPVTSPEPPLPPRVYKPCCVCGDRSSGYHYGVSSCEGCKGFFRRSVQKNVQYLCPRDSNCLINKANRSRCQFCRLQKCLAVGMLRESVRNDRRKKRGKEKQVSPSHRREFFPPDPIPEPLNNLIRDISEAQIHTSPSLTDITRFRPDSSQPARQGESFNIELWEQFSDRSTKCIVKIVEFAKMIPGFAECTMCDQITLIKAASMDVLVLRLCSRYCPDDDTMTFSDGLTLNQHEMRNCGFGPITQAVYAFAKSLWKLGLDETEVGLLSAICIVCPDRLDLEEPKKVEEIQGPILEALRLHTRQRRPRDPLIFPRLLMKVADLRTISVRGSERAVTLNMEIPYDTMPPLITEMLLRGNY